MTVVSGVLIYSFRYYAFSFSFPFMANGSLPLWILFILFISFVGIFLRSIFYLLFFAFIKIMYFLTAFLLFNGLTDRRPVFPLLVVFRDWERYVNLMMGSCRYPLDAFIVGLTKNCTGVSFWQIGRRRGE